MIKLIAATAGALALLSSAGYAADLVPAPQVAAEMAAVDWSGAYAGANIGYGSGTFAPSEGIGLPISISLGTSGITAGGQIGYNYQLRNGAVFGVEGDLDWSNESGTFSIGGPSITADINWFGAVTGHVGYAWDNVLPYVLAGAAIANVSLNSNLGAPASAISATHVGYTLGVGVADMLTSSVSAFAEVRYNNYGTANYSESPVPGITLTQPAAFTDTTVRAGVNFHF